MVKVLPDARQLLRCGGFPYSLALLLRLAFTLMPANTGYIHPDEHFQSVEVVVGDVLGFSTLQTWEWDPDNPLRSPTLPLLLYGLPALLLRLLDLLVSSLLGASIFTPSLLQMMARLPLFVISLATDLSVFQLSRHLQLPSKTALLLLGSSHLMWVYATRPLANNLELAFTSLLLLLTLIPRRERPGVDWSNILPIGAICALGTFNRPTFIVFAGWPLLAWFLRGVSSLKQLASATSKRLMPLCLATLLPCMAIVLLDSLYFADLTLTKLLTLNVFLADWKLTPLNFLIFNLTPGNAAQFGSDDRLTHLLVNLPILFGPLSLLFWLSLPRLVRKKETLRVLFLSFITPLIAFSLLDHQEPRFLLPLIPSLLLLLSPLSALSHFPFLLLWLLFNLVAGLFWGLLNQAGLLPLLALVQDLHLAAPVIHLVLPWAWMAPRLPLMVRPPQVFQVHDWVQKEVSLSEVETTLKNLTCQSQAATLLGLPSHLLPAFTELEHNLQLDEVGTVWPHLSLESMVASSSTSQPLNPVTVAVAFINFLASPKDWGSPKKGLLSLSLFHVTNLGPCPQYSTIEY